MWFAGVDKVGLRWRPQGGAPFRRNAAAAVRTYSTLDADDRAYHFPKGPIFGGRHIAATLAAARALCREGRSGSLTCFCLDLLAADDLALVVVEARSNRTEHAAPIRLHLHDAQVVLHPRPSFPMQRWDVTRASSHDYGI